MACPCDLCDGNGRVDVFGVRVPCACRPDDVALPTCFLPDPRIGGERK